MQHEVRLARAEMTKALVAMCTRLDDSGARSAQYTHELAGDVMSVFTPSRLWVFGSYARGATECGDLDALIELDYQAGPCPPTEVVENVLFGEVSRLSLSLGTPEQNKAGLDIADAVLIWSGKGSDWHTAIDSIKVDPDAGRFERDHDQLPLRAQQHDDEPMAERFCLYRDALYEAVFGHRTFIVENNVRRAPTEEELAAPHNSFPESDAISALID